MLGGILWNDIAIFILKTITNRSLDMKIDLLLKDSSSRPQQAVRLIEGKLIPTTWFWH